MNGRNCAMNPGAVEVTSNIYVIQEQTVEDKYAYRVLSNSGKGRGKA